jgi:hypothetical protein
MRPHWISGYPSGFYVKTAPHLQAMVLHAPPAAFRKITQPKTDQADGRNSEFRFMTPPNLELLGLRTQIAEMVSFFWLATSYTQAASKLE